MNKDILKEYLETKFKYFDLNMKGFSLPVVEKYDSNYYDSLKRELNRYNTYIQSLNEFPEKLKNNVHDNIELVIKSVEYYYNARFEDAKKCILSIINKYVDNNFVVSDLKDSYIYNKRKINKDYIDVFDGVEQKVTGLFRGRTSVERLCRKDMLHIPLDKRGLVSTNRFSMNGIPCIYLATSTYGCWLELNMPSKYMLQVSSIRIPDDIKVLNLAISQSFIQNMSVCNCDEDVSFLIEMLEIFPLVYATSYNILETNRVFKSEYIISHLIMQCMKELGIEAVAYLSKKIEDNYAYPFAVNIAIPVEKDFLKNNLYWLRAKDTSLTEPMSYDDFINKWGYNIDTSIRSYSGENYVDVLGNPVDFNTLKFSVFDKYLTRSEHEYFKE